VTQAISNLTAVERNCWLQIIRGIQKKKDLPDGHPEKYQITLSRTQLLECVSGHSSNLDYAFNALKNITDAKKVFHSKDGHRIYAGLLSYVDEHPDQETYTVGITPVLLPYFTNLSSEFTVFDMYIEMGFKSVYSQRFYEFCCQYRNKEDKVFFMTVQDIKKMFNLLEVRDEKGNVVQKEQYKNGSDFKKRVLDKAKDDIRKVFDAGLCDVCFDYKVKSKNSRGAVTAYYFIIETNGNTAKLGAQKPTIPQISMLSESYGAKLTKLLTIINTFMRSHFRVEQSNYYVQAISRTVAKVDSQSERVEILNSISKQLKKIATRYNKEDFDTNERKICGSVCKMLYEDFGVPYMNGKPGKGTQSRLNF
jgi:plasmid replication initiation protein